MHGKQLRGLRALRGYLPNPESQRDDAIAPDPSDEEHHDCGEHHQHRDRDCGLQVADAQLEEHRGGKHFGLIASGARKDQQRAKFAQGSGPGERPGREHGEEDRATLDEDRGRAEVSWHAVA